MIQERIHIVSPEKKILHIPREQRCFNTFHFETKHEIRIHHSWRSLKGVIKNQARMIRLHLNAKHWIRGDIDPNIERH